MQISFIKNAVFTITACITSSISFGQITDNTRINDGGNNRPNQLMTIRKDYSDVKAEGTPYYHNAFKKGVIVNNGVETLADGMRYNGFSDNIEVTDGGKQYDLLRRDYLYALIESDTLRIYSYNLDNENKTGYLIPKAVGKISFYFKPSIRLTEGKEPKSGFEEYIPPRYVEDYKYFISENGGTLSEVKLNNRTAKELFSAKWKEVNKYIKDQGLSVKEVDDFAKIVSYYNGL